MNGVSNWIDASTARPDETENVLITGFIGNDPNQGRYFAIADYCEGQYFDPDTGDEFYPPTHWATIYAPE